MQSNSLTINQGVFEHNQPFKLKNKQILDQFEIAYQTYGKLNTQKNNAILICHALTANQHVAGIKDDGKLGWWDNFVGIHKAFDTNKFFIVCANNLGGCSGSTGPSSINPKTQKKWGNTFPIVQVEDWVETQGLLADFLGIKKWLCVAGGSLGGMQVMQWAVRFPKRLESAIVISAAQNLNAQNIAFNEVARQAIKTDSNFNEGDFYDKQPPKQGLMLARMLGHITYLSGSAMNEKFGRQLTDQDFKYDINQSEFQVESYLQHQGKSFIDKQKFDANTYLRMTKALDYFDPAKQYDGDLSQLFANVLAKFLVISFSSDWRFSPERSKEIVKALIKAGKKVSYTEIKSEKGHDSFLLENEHYQHTLNNYLNYLYKTKVNQY